MQVWDFFTISSSNSRPGHAELYEQRTILTFTMPHRDCIVVIPPRTSLRSRGFPLTMSTDASSNWRVG